MRVNSPSDAEIIIQKLSCDMGIHRNPRKGTLNAPEEIIGDLEFGKKVLIDEVFPDEFDLERTHSRIYDNTLELAKYERSVVSIGGDHSVSYPLIKALKQENPGMSLVWLDAHLDLKEKVGENVSHDVVVRQLVEEGLFEPEDIYFVGITEIDHDEENFLEEHDFKFYESDELSQFLEEYESDGPCYLSIDIDVLNEKEAPGTGYPDGQLTVTRVQEVVRKVKPVYADIVEVAPSLDIENTAVQNAETILETLVSTVDF